MNEGGEMLAEKRRSRLEKKKKKIEAFLDVAELNDADKRKKSKIKSDGDCTSGMSVQDQAATKVMDDATIEEKVASLRAKLMARQKASMQRPKLFLKVPGMSVVGELRDWVKSGAAQGEGSSAHVDHPFQLENASPLFALDLQHLLLYAIQGNVSTFKPRWCKLLRVGKIHGVLVIELPGVTQKDFVDNPDCFQFLRKNFDMCVDMVSPLQYGSSMREELLQVPYSFAMMRPNKNMKLEKNTMVLTREVEDEAEDTAPEGFSRVDLVLNMQQLVQERCPLPIHVETDPDFVYSQDKYTELTPVSPLFAVDCEMCIGVSGRQLLTWVAVIDEKLETVFQSLVKPTEKIKDYVTKYSGVTAKRLQNVTTRLQDVQAALRDILTPDSILCGQSLNSDLRALKMFHPYVIDTSVIFNLTGNRQHKPGLRKLAAELLGKHIQQGRQGHSPLEDAEATMELVLLKLKNGPTFGDVILGGYKQVHDTAREIKAAGDSCDVTSGEASGEESPEERPNTGNKRPVDSSSDSASSSEEESDEPQQKRLKPDSTPPKQDAGAKSGAVKAETTPEAHKKQKAFFFQRPGVNMFRNLLSLPAEADKKVAVLGAEADLQTWGGGPKVTPTFSDDVAASITYLPRKNAKSCSRECRLALESHHVVWATLQETPRLGGETSGGESAGDKSASHKPDKRTLQKLDKRIRKAMKNCRDMVVVSVVFGGGANPNNDENAVCFVKVT